MKAYLFSILLALTACGGDDVVRSTSGGGPTPAPPPAVIASVEREISPATVNPQITAHVAAHFALNPSPAAAARGRLFVMLPGTTGIPRFYRQIVRAGAARGYHGIGLTYPNDEAVGTLCAPTADPDCPGDTRREIILGENASTVVSVDSANAIVPRLAALLAYLHTTFPNEGWGQYLSGGQPVWSRIVIAGHSQGGGHAAYLAKLFVLDRSVMFSSPSDVSTVPNIAANWLQLPNMTPASRQYGFAHTQDELVPLDLIAFNWQALGLGEFGAQTLVDGVTAPFSNSRRLVTSLPPNPNPPGPVPAPNHSATVLDAVTPLNAAGRPVYTPVWEYLAFP